MTIDPRITAGAKVPNPYNAAEDWTIKSVDGDNVVIIWADGSETCGRIGPGTAMASALELMDIRAFHAELAAELEAPTEPAADDAPITFTAGSYYVMDAFATTARAAYVSGPFPTFIEGERDRHARNIGADCETWKAPRTFTAHADGSVSRA